MEKYLERSTVENLAEQSGITTRTIEALLRGERKTAKFVTADRLICATDGPQVWRDDPALADLYGGGS